MSQINKNQKISDSIAVKLLSIDADMLYKIEKSKQFSFKLFSLLFCKYSQIIHEGLGGYLTLQNIACKANRMLF